MQFYEPGPYEEFVAKLSSLNAKPDPDVWQTINARLDQNFQLRKRNFFKSISIAASILLLFGFSISVYFTNHVIIGSDFLSQLDARIVVQSNLNNKSLNNFKSNSEREDLELELETNNVSLIQVIKEGNNITNDNIEKTKPLIKSLAFDSPNLEKQSQTNSYTKPFVRESSFYNFDNNSNSLDGQTVKKSSEGTWSLIAYINPAYSYHTAGAIDYKLNPSETGAWMWGGEVLVKKEVSSYFAVYSGIQVSPSGQNINNFTLPQSSKGKENYLIANTTFGQVDLNNSFVDMQNIPSLAMSSNGVFKSSTIDDAELKQRFYYMEIPLIVSTTLKTDHFDLELKLGCAAGVLIDNKFELISSDGYFVGRTENIRPHNASAIGALSLSLPFNNQFSVIIEPNVRLNLYPLSYGFETTYPFSASVKFGMGYRF